MDTRQQLIDDTPSTVSETASSSDNEIPTSSSPRHFTPPTSPLSSTGPTSRPSTFLPHGILPMSRPSTPLSHDILPTSHPSTPQSDSPIAPQVTGAPSTPAPSSPLIPETSSLSPPATSSPSIPETSSLSPPVTSSPSTPTGSRPSTPLAHSASVLFPSPPGTPLTTPPGTPAGGKTPRRKSPSSITVKSDDLSDAWATKLAKMGGVSVHPNGTVLDEKNKPKRPPMFCLLLQVQKNGLSSSSSTTNRPVNYIFPAQKSGHQWFFERCFNPLTDKLTAAGECLLSDTGVMLFWSPHSGTYGHQLYGSKSRKEIDQMEVLSSPHIDYHVWENVMSKMEVLPLASESSDGDVYSNGVINPKRKFSDVFRKWQNHLLDELKKAPLEKETKDSSPPTERPGEVVKSDQPSDTSVQVESDRKLEQGDQQIAEKPFSPENLEDPHPHTEKVTQQSERTEERSGFPQLSFFKSHPTSSTSFAFKDTSKLMSGLQPSPEKLHGRGLLFDRSFPPDDISTQKLPVDPQAPYSPRLGSK